MKRKRARIYKPKASKLGASPTERFTPAEEALARQISNDIAEHMDNEQTRQELRMAVDFWAAEAQRMHIQFIVARDEFIKLAKEALHTASKIKC